MAMKPLSVVWALALPAALVGVGMLVQLPERFSYQSWPTSGCPSPVMRFNASCSGVHMAGGEEFDLVLSDVEVGWQNLYVTATVYNREQAEHGVMAVKTMRQDVDVRDRSDEAWVDVGAAKVVDWPLRCEQGAETCDEAFVLLRSGLPQRQLRLRLSLVTDYADPLDVHNRHVERFMGEVIFHTRHETPQFTRYELVLRYSMVAVALLALVRFLASFRLEGGGSIPVADWQPAQQALVVLMVGAVLNNNPLFVLWAWYGAWYMQLVEQLQQAFLLYAVALWVLVVFDGMSYSPRERGMFWLGKLLLVGALWALDSTELVLFQLALRQNLSAVRSDLPLYPYVWVYARSFLQALVVMYVLTVFFKAFISVSGRTRRVAADLAFFASVSLLTAAFFFVARPDQLADDDFSSLWVLISMGTLNAYVVCMGVAFEPSAATRDAFEQTDALRIEAVELLHAASHRSSEKPPSLSDQLRARLTTASSAFASRFPIPQTPADDEAMDGEREGVISEDDEMMSIKLEHLSSRSLAHLFTLGVLLTMIISGIAAGRLPERFAYQSWPTSGCPSPVMRFNASCSGVHMAGGEEFDLVLSDVEVGWQNLYVTATVYNLASAEHGIIADQTMRQDVDVRDRSDEAWVDVGAAKVVDWPLRCEQGAETCDEAFVLLRSGLPQRQLRLRLSLVTDYADPLDVHNRHVERFMGEVIFHTRHETPQFTRYELVLRYSMVAVALLALVRFLASFRLEGGGSIPVADWQPAQQALVVLMVGAVLNNNPLFVLWAWYGAWYMQLVEQLQQAFLLYAVALWVLVVFDGMSYSPRERGMFWLGKLLLVGALWALDSTELVLFQLALRQDLSAVRSDLPLYPYVWVYARSFLQAGVTLLALTVFFRAFIVLTGDSKRARAKFSSFVATTALTAVCLGVARPDQLEEDNFSSLWVLISMGALNAYVVLMGLAFQPAEGAKASFVLSSEQRQQGLALLQTIATSSQPSALYNEALLVKTVSAHRGKNLTLEQEKVIVATVQRNPVMNRTAAEDPEAHFVGTTEERVTPKLRADEAIPSGSLMTLVRGRATRFPLTAAAISDVWLGEWFVCGPPPSAVRMRRLLGRAAAAAARPDDFVTCVAEGSIRMQLTVEGPAASGAQVVAKYEASKARVYAAVDRGLNNILAQTVGYLEEAITPAAFAEASRGARLAEVSARVRVVGKYHDPFEWEEELRFPYAIVMKDICDEGLLRGAANKQVVALKQAVERAAAMRWAAEGGASDEPKPAAAEAAEAVEMSQGAQALEEAELEAKLESGEWKGEAPRSTEEQEALTLLGDHFEVRLFHVERGGEKKAVLLLQMKGSALKRELHDFLLERWENEGKRAVSSASGVRFTEVSEMVLAVEAGELRPTPAEKLELYERLLRKLFHAVDLGQTRLPSGSLAGVKKGMSEAALEQHQLEMDKRFSPVSFRVWERPKAIDDLQASEAIAALAKYGVELSGRETTAQLRSKLATETDYEADQARLPSAILRQDAIERGACFELIESVFPRHHLLLNSWLQRKLSRERHLSTRDLTIVRNHYGEELALYMAFMNTYNQTLLPFALLGALVFVVCLFLPGSYTANYTYLAPLYCVCMVIFAALLQMLWAHENQRLRYDWGITDYMSADYVRPEFKGEKQWDFVRQRLAYEFPEWKRSLKIRPISFFVVFLMTLLLMVVTFALYMQLQDSLENPNPIYDFDVLYWLFGGAVEVPLRMVLGSGLNGILYGVLIMVIYMTFFQAVAHQLTRLENYRTEREFHDNYVLKMFFFIFVDGYMMFWILGLYHIPLATYSSFEELSDVSIVGVRLFYKPGQLSVYQEQLTSVCVAAIVTVQLLTFLLENVLPFIIKHYSRKGTRKWRASLSPRERFLQAVCEEGEREKFDLFGDYYDSVLFLGYGVVYSLLWPLAPLVNYANNMVELRADLSKVVEILRRPTPRKTATIGMWESCMWFQTFTSVVQLALVSAFSTPLYDDYMRAVGFDPESEPELWETHGDETHVRVYVKLVCSVVVMVVGFGIILTVRQIIGDKDPRTKLRLARDEFLERKASVEQWEGVRHGRSSLAVLKARCGK